MASEKFNQIKYQHEYNRKNYDRIELNVPKGKKAIIKECAKSAGVSMNEYINQAINRQINEKATT